MKRGPRKGYWASRRPGQHMANAEAAWGAPLPHWLAALATASDAGGLAEAGRRIGYSAATVSQTLNRKYPGDLNAVENAAHGALLAPPADHPPRACATCPHYQRGTP